MGGVPGGGVVQAGLGPRVGGDGGQLLADLCVVPVGVEGAYCDGAGHDSGGLDLCDGGGLVQGVLGHGVGELHIHLDVSLPGHGQGLDDEMAQGAGLTHYLASPGGQGAFLAGLDLGRGDVGVVGLLEGAQGVAGLVDDGIGQGGHGGLVLGDPDAELDLLDRQVVATVEGVEGDEDLAVQVEGEGAVGAGGLQDVAGGQDAGLA